MNSKSLVKELSDEIEQLKALLKRVEWIDQKCDAHVCHFCGVYSGERHAIECEGFTPDGEVR